MRARPSRPAGVCAGVVSGIAATLITFSTVGLPVPASFANPVYFASTSLVFPTTGTPGASVTGDFNEENCRERRSG